MAGVSATTCVGGTSIGTGRPYENVEGTGAQTQFVGHPRIKTDVPSLPYTLACVNSSLISWYFREVFATGTLQGSYSHTYPKQIRAFPICRVTFNTPTIERKRHVAKGRELYERCLAGSDAASVLEFVEKQLAEKRTDAIHDLLAFLAEQMMKLNSDKQTAAKQFLTDLKDFHGVDARSLTPKTKLDEFWKLQAGEVFAHLRANLKALAAQGIRLKDSDEEKIRTRFQKATDKLLPLESEIAFTDTLIDQIVYRLYGLTPAEIKLVEENARH